MITSSEIKTITGAKAIIKTLKSFGVDTVFGYPGGVVLDLYDEIYKDKTINHILCRHEQACVHAAEGYARESGKCGVVFVTSGPGATNIVTGVANAYMDGYPLIILTGQVCENLIGKNAFQEVNICNITKSCTKKTFQITSSSDIQSIIKEAYNTAMTGKKGPVVVDIIKDVFSQLVNEESEFKHIELKISEKKDITSIINRINNSKSPVIVAGGGVKHSSAQEILEKFSKKYSIPVVSTMMGLGTYPQDNVNYFGMIGIFGDNSANEIIKKSDLVISFGARFNDRIINRKFLDGKLIQIDINPKEISRNVQAQDFIIGDIKDVISGIKLEKSFEKWCEFAQTLKNLNTKPEKNSNLLHSFEVIQKLESYTKNKEITFTTEVGQHQLWAVRNLKFGKNRKIFVSGGLGTMGFGLPSAIGCAVADMTKPVVCITGDGSFQMSLPELATCSDYDLNIKIIILNNGYLGMVRQLQEKNCDRRYSQTKISNPDFVTLAKSYGIDAVRVTKSEEIEDAFSRAFSNSKTYIIDFVVEPEEVL